MSKEMKPGEVREVNNRQYQAMVSEDNCNGCAFENIVECDLASSALGHCCTYVAVSGIKHVIFVDVTDQKK